MEYLFILQRIFSISVVVVFFRWLIAYFINIANFAKQLLSDDEEGEMKKGEAKEKEALIVCFGEMLIDFVPDIPGESLAETSKFIKSPGGAPANVAVAISKLGGSSAFIGKFGNDEFGQMLVEILKRNGVKQEGICLEPEARTGLAFVSFKKNGERDFIFYGSPSANMLLKESEVNMDLIRSAKIFHFGSISLVSEPCKGAHMAAIKAAKDAGLLLSYDPKVRLSLWPSPQAARQGISSILNQAHIIKVSDEELAFLTERDPYLDDSAMSLWFDGLKLLVVTYGYKGCGYFTKDFRGKVSGYAVETVDTTGAGDAFVGALLTSVAKDTSILEDEKKLRGALTFANACGALSTTQKGAIPALPTTSMALQLITQKSTSSELSD